jgi:DNA polymerase-3 subunit alpha
MLDYVSLHNHTTFSIGDALTTPTELFSAAKELNQKAIAVTDHGTGAGFIDCLGASKKAGVKLIPGIEFYFTDDAKQTEDTSLRHLILLAKNHQGYKNLLALHLKGFDYATKFQRKIISRIDWEELAKYSEGLICTTACGNGIPGQFIMNDEFDKALESCKKLKDIFGDNLAIELQPHLLQRKASYASGMINQQKINLGLKKIAVQLNIRPIVATDIHYAKKELHDDHDVFICISSGQPKYSGNRLSYDKNDFYPKSADEIYNYFARHKNMWGEQFINSLFENTVYFAEQCDNPKWIDPVVATGEKCQLPDFKIKETEDYEDFKQWDKEATSPFYKKDIPEDSKYYRYSTEKGIKARIESGQVPKEDFDYCVKSSEEEFDVLETKGFCSYMLIVADFLKWARNNNILLGFGRGSAGGSITAYANFIHELYPKRYNVIFARFLNKFKDAYPDVDCDISPSGLTKIHKYLQKKYGKECFARISNVNTITPKVYIKYIAKVFEFGGSRAEAIRYGNLIADSVPGEYHSIEKAVDGVPVFAEFVKQFPELLKYAKSICGKPSAWGMHAGGIVVAKRSLIGLVSLRKDEEGEITIELTKHAIEPLGLIKIDTLGLKTLDTISSVYEVIKKTGKPVPKIDVEGYDKKTYDMIGAGDTFGVFQLDKTAVHVCKKIKPKNISDLAMISSLVRPAVKDIIPELVAVKNGEKEATLLHPALKRAYQFTYGFPLFEESLMFVAADVPHWNLHKTDDLRKLCKEKNKYPEKVKKLREEFINDSKAQNFTEEMAIKIWDNCIANFSGYGFNVPHATTYSMTSYVTAYLKANYPLEFAVANIIKECHSGAKIAKSNINQWKQMVRAEHVKIVPPDINNSDISYSIINSKTLMAGLDSLKYMGKDNTNNAISEILAKRPFTSFQDFILRTDSSKVKSTAIASMAASGCLDCFHMDRQKLFYYSADYRTKLKASIRKLHKEVEKEWFKANKINITKEGKGDEVLYKDKENNILSPPVPTEDQIKKCIQAFEYPFPDEPKWSVQEIFALEEFYMGEGLSGTFLDRYPGFFTQNSLVFQILKDQYPYVKKSEDLKKDRKANSYRFQDFTGCPIEVVIADIHEFKVKNEESKIFGQVMARIKVKDWMEDELTLVCFPDAWDAAKERIEKSYINKTKIQPGLAIQVNGMFQWESENSPSIILDEVITFCPAPVAPKDKKSRKVKMPKLNKFIEIEAETGFEDVSKEELAEALEEEISDEGLESSWDEEFNLDEFADPFN